MWMARNLHSGIRCPVEDDPPDIRAPNPGAIGYSVTRLRDFLSFWRKIILLMIIKKNVSGCRGCQIVEVPPLENAIA